MQNSTISVTFSKLPSSTNYNCCISTNAEFLNTDDCSLVMIGELMDTPAATTSNCSAIGGGLGALIIILVHILIGVVCIVVYLKFWQKMKPIDHEQSASVG